MPKFQEVGANTENHGRCYSHNIPKWAALDSLKKILNCIQKENTYIYIYTSRRFVVVNSTATRSTVWLGLISIFPHSSLVIESFSPKVTVRVAGVTENYTRASAILSPIIIVVLSAAVRYLTARTASTIVVLMIICNK